MRLVLLLLTLLPVLATASSPGEAVASASVDVAKISKEDRKYARYFSLYAIPPKDRDEFRKVFSFHVNSLSRKAKLVHPTLVTPDLLRVDVRDYKWNPEVFEKLAQVDPYFHALITIQEEKTVDEDWPGGVWTDGKEYPKGSFKTRRTVKEPKKKEVAAIAPWLPTKEASYLSTETESKVPILRADWFFIQTAVNAERVAGYYAFLELKKKDDFEKLIGLNVKEAQRIEREVASIVQDSGVSIRNRQIYRFGAIDAGYWQTRDVFAKQTQEKNAINSLNGDYVHDAEEHYGFLPNRLFAYYLSDAKGNQQDTAPDQVGPDTTSPNNDYRIHVFKSCVTCHVEGLRPIDDYGRQLFQGPTRLVSYDKKKFERLEQLYLLPLRKWLDRDVRDYADTLAELNGATWTPAKNASAYKVAWRAWYVDKVTPEVAARELGHYKAEDVVKALRRYASPVPDGGLGQVTPNVLLAFMHDKPLPMLREHWEEVYSLTQQVMRGYVPAVEDKEKKKP